MEGLELKFDLPLDAKSQPDDLSLKLEEGEVTEESLREARVTTTEEVPAPPIEVTEEVEVEEDFSEEVLPTSKVISEIFKSLYGVDTIERELEDGEVEEVHIDDANFTVEDLVNIINENHKDSIKELKGSSVSLEGLDEVRQSMITAIKSGMNPKDVIYFQDRYVDPMSSIDISTEEGQIQMLEIRYKDSLEQGTMDKADFDRIIRGLKEDDELEQKAEEAYNQLTEALNNKAKEMAEKAKEDEQNRKTFYREYKKDFTSIAKEKFNLKDTTAKNLVDLVLEPDENEPRMTKLNAKVLQILRNPESAVKLALHVFDEEKYEKLVKSKVQIEVLEDTKKKIRFKKKAREAQGSSFADDEITEDKVLFKM